MVCLSSLKSSALYLHSFLRNVADTFHVKKSFKDDNFRPEVNINNSLADTNVRYGRISPKNLKEIEQAISEKSPKQICKKKKKEVFRYSFKSRKDCQSVLHVIKLSLFS